MPVVQSEYPSFMGGPSLRWRLTFVSDRIGNQHRVSKAKRPGTRSSRRSTRTSNLPKPQC